MSEAVVTPQTPADQPQPEKDNPIERRIGQLVAQRKEAEERAASLNASTAELQAQVLRLSEELATFKATQSAPAAQPLAGPVSGVDVAKVIDDRFAAWDKRATEREQAQQGVVALHRAQVQSAAQATAEFPELADPNSALRAVADRVFGAMPELRRSPTGPYQAIVMARGLLADQQAPEQPNPRKITASTGPMGATGVPALDKSAVKKETEALLAKHKEATDALRMGEGDTTKNYVMKRHIETRLRELGVTDF
jgi:hypothetical protein